MLLRAADCLRQSMGAQGGWKGQDDTDDNASAGSVSLSKEELEQTAEKFRADLDLSYDEPLDSLRIEVQGVQVIPVGKTNCLDARTGSVHSGKRFFVRAISVNPESPKAPCPLGLPQFSNRKASPLCPKPHWLPKMENVSAGLWTHGFGVFLR